MRKKESLPKTRLWITDGALSSCGFSSESSLFLFPPSRDAGALLQLDWDGSRDSEPNAAVNEDVSHPPLAVSRGVSALTSSRRLVSSVLRQTAEERRRKW